MTREKPVGSAERSVLEWLARNSGRWTEDDGTVWESKFWTLQLLVALAAKGLVNEVVAGAHYELSPKGNQLLVGQVFGGTVPNQQVRPYTGDSSTRRSGSSQAYRRFI